MYRDSATILDERDRVVGSILIGEVLVDECERAAGVICNADAVSHPERWRTITGVHDTYPEIWRHLDRARSLLAGRGANTTRYDEMRPRARRAPTNAEGTDIDQAALHDARRAIEDLKLAVPGADWNAIHRRTAGLVAAPIGRARGQRAIMIAIIAALVFALGGWLVALIPGHKPDPRAAMRRELSQISLERKTKIALTTVELGKRCDVVLARELTKLLAMDGRTADAHGFGADFMERCGDDGVVDNWAHAPKPPQR